MVSASSVSILHITDLHANSNGRREIAKRFEALSQKLQERDERVTFVVVSGDIANTGTKQEYEMARSLIDEHVVNNLAVAPDHVLICPGNHDVNRASIDEIDEAGFASKIRSAPSADKFWGDPKFRNRCLDRLREYFEFASGGGYTSSPRIFELGDSTIGFVPLNSAWRSSSDDDKGRIFVGTAQFSEQFDCVSGADVRVALMHHPLSWLHEDEQSPLITQMAQRIQLLLLGHRHISDTHNRDYPNGSMVLSSARAFHGAAKTGFTTIRIDIESRNVQLSQWEYKARRAAFAPDTELSDTGIQEYPLSLLTLPTVAAREYTKLLVQANKADERIALGVQNLAPKLCKATKLPFLEPTIQTYQMGSLGSKSKAPIISIEGILSSKQSWIVGGSKLSGKTTLLTILQARSARKGFTPVMLAPSALFPGNQLIRAVAEAHRLSITRSTDVLAAGAAVLIDDVPSVGVVERDTLEQWRTEFPNCRFFVVSRTPILSSISEANELGDHWSAAQIAPIGLASIAAIAESLRHEGLLLERDVGAIRVLINATFESELPRVPWVVLMFLELWISGFKLVGAAISDLLRNYSQHRLQILAVDPDVSPDIAARALQLIANLLFERAATSVSRGDAIEILDREFKASALIVDAQNAISKIEATGLIEERPDGLGFAFSAFLDYYYAAYLDTKGTDVARDLTVEILRQRGPAYAVLNNLRASPDLTAMAFKIALDTRTSMKESLEEADFRSVEMLSIPSDSDLPEGEDHETLTAEFDEVLGPTEDARRGHRASQIENRLSESTIIQFLECFTSALTILRAGTFLSRESKRRHVRDAVLMAIALCDTMIESVRLARDEWVAKGKDDCVHKALEAISIPLSVATSGCCLDQYCGAHHLLETLREAFQSDRDHGHRLILLIWLSSVNESDLERWIHEYVAQKPPVTHLAVLQSWFYVQYCISTALEGQKDARARSALKMVAAASASRSAPSRASRQDVNQHVDALLRRADANARERTA